MFFRNLALFHFPTTTKLDALDAGLAECLLEPVGPLNCPIAASSRLSGAAVMPCRVALATHLASHRR
jgi:hypothetical protein